MSLPATACLEPTITRYRETDWIPVKIHAEHERLAGYATELQRAWPGHYETRIEALEDGACYQLEVRHRRK